jgi:hypothetical protein
MLQKGLLNCKFIFLSKGRHQTRTVSYYQVYSIIHRKLGKAIMLPDKLRGYQKGAPSILSGTSYHIILVECLVTPAYVSLVNEIRQNIQVPQLLNQKPLKKLQTR